MKHFCTTSVLFFVITLGQLLAQNTTPKQGDWLWRADDGNEANASSFGFTDPIEISDVNNIRLRVEMYDTHSGYLSDTFTMYLCYSTDGGSHWLQVKNTASAPNNQPFTLSPSDNFNNKDWATESLLGGNSYGYMIESSESFQYTLNQGASSEFEFCIKPSQYIATNATYHFALYVIGTGVLTPFNQYPYLTTGSTLPVELISFTSRNVDAGIRLNWETATEINNYGFEVEKKSNGSWEKIGFVEGSGNSNSIKNYSYTDKAVSGNLSYRLKQIDFDGSFKYSKEIEASVKLPAQFSLDQNYPNPFNPATSISYQLPNDEKVVLKIYNILGSEVTTLVNENQSAGNHKVTFDASGLSSGIYFYSIQAGSFSQTRKMILNK